MAGAHGEAPGSQEAEGERGGRQEPSLWFLGRRRGEAGVQAWALLV